MGQGRSGGKIIRVLLCCHPTNMSATVAKTPYKGEQMGSHSRKYLPAVVGQGSTLRKSLDPSQRSPWWVTDAPWRAGRRMPLGLLRDFLGRAALAERRPCARERGSRMD